jgi:zinc transport system substrate-binding protein
LNGKKSKFSKITCIILTIIAVFSISLTACNVTKKSNNGKINVVATIFPAYDFAQQVGGDKINLQMLLTPGSESHTFDPSPKDITAVAGCDVFIYNGGESDAWVDKILQSVDTKNVKIIKMMDCVATVPEELVEGMEEEKHSHDGENVEEHDHETAENENPYEPGTPEFAEWYEKNVATGINAGENSPPIILNLAGDNSENAEKSTSADVEYDEHVWTSPKNAMKICERISDIFTQVDGENSTVYDQNLATYKAQLADLDGKFREIVENSSKNTLIFGDRFPFRYFADEYGLEYFAAFPGCSAQTEPSPSTVAFLIEKVKNDKIPIVLKLELSNGNIAQTIAESTGAEVKTFNSCHNITKDQFKDGVTYLQLMTENVATLSQCLM